MTILHLPNSLNPQVTGGTDLFIHRLIDAQLAGSSPRKLP